jgi:TonB-linked SusC/RagA family outer membrane protein
MRRILLLFLGVFCCCFMAQAQNKTITGTVVSKSDNLPLPGVSVKVEGTNTGTQTQTNGKFTLQVPANATLVFSFLGYAPVKVPVTGQTNYNVSLEEDSKALDEVVVTSFGIARDKKTLGYGVSTVKAEEITKSPVTDISNALAGKIAGVQVSGAGGGFASSNITIRGFSSITRSNQPLYVIDGVPIDNGGGGNSSNSGAANSSRASDINNEDIESISVLKGAAATVLYGSRAASGVILITTKKGKVGTKSQVNFTSNTAIGSVNIFPDFQNEYAQGDNGIYGTAANPFGWTPRATSWGPRIAGQTVKNILGQDVTLQAYPDNVRDILQHSLTTQNTISFSGASDKFNYRVSYGNNNETGLVPGNELHRNNFSVNAGTAISSKFRINTSFTFTNNRSNRTQGGNQGANPLWRAIYTPRTYDISGLPVTDAQGNQIWYSGSEENPYWAIDHVTSESEINRFYGNVNLKYDFTSWLQADLKVGADVFSSNSIGFDDKGVRSNGNTTSAGLGGLTDTKRLNRNLNSYLTLTANKDFGDFNLSGTLGNEIVSNYNSSLNGTGRSITIPGFKNLKNFTTLSTSDSYQQDRILGVFGDISVGYKGYINLNVKARNDFSSTLSPGNRSIFYPAVAVSFVATEAFPSLKGKVLSSAKIRANVGEVGKGADAYATNSLYNSAAASDGLGSTGVSFPFNGLAGFTYAGLLGNVNIRPEFTREIELGTELSFFSNRIFLDFSVYKRDSRDLIFEVPVASSSGNSSFLQNAGKLSTKGLEFLLTGTPIKSKNFSWETSLNFTTFKSVVKELAPGVSLISLGGFTSPNVQAVTGQQYPLIYSNMYIRDSQGRMVIKDNGLPSATSQVGNIGNPNPKFTTGLTNTLTYKAVSFSFLFDFKYKGDILSRTLGDLEINGVDASTAERNRFNADGTVATPYIFEGVKADGSPNTTYVSAQSYFSLQGKYVAWEGYVRDATFLKLREATLSYAFPKAMLAKTKFINALSLSIYGRNLWTYAPHFKGLDPEQNLLGVGNARGLEFGIQPVARTFGASLKATF